MKLNKDVVKNEVPLLEQEKIERDYCPHFDNRAKLFRSWNKMFLIFVLSVVALIAVLLFVWAMGKGEIDMSSEVWNELSSGFLETFFPNFTSNEDKGDDVNGDSPSSSDDIPVISTPPDNSTSDNESQKNDNFLKDLYYFDRSKIPSGEIAIIPSDISNLSMGEFYINNSTGYSPNVVSLLNAELSNGGLLENISKKTEPTVLIIHTHATEAYSVDGAISYLDDGQDLSRSVNEDENVISLGEILANTLNENGIVTLHCKVLHDYPQYKDSYLRAKETIQKYLEEYPSIKLVIDLHRDAVFNSSEEMIRPVTLVNGEPTAQMMCVVGSDWGGDTYTNWENNLSLALKIRKYLNDKYFNVCRPVELRSATYNQELSEYALLVEVGSCGNSIEEAKRALSLLSYAIVEIIKNIP